MNNLIILSQRGYVGTIALIFNSNAQLLAILTELNKIGYYPNNYLNLDTGFVIINIQGSGVNNYTVCNTDNNIQIDYMMTITDVCGKVHPNYKNQQVNRSI